MKPRVRWQLDARLRAVRRAPAALLDRDIGRAFCADRYPWNRRCSALAKAQLDDTSGSNGAVHPGGLGQW